MSIDGAYRPTNGVKEILDWTTMGEVYRAIGSPLRCYFDKSLTYSEFLVVLKGRR